MALLCALGHRWTEWQEKQIDELAAQLGIPTQTMRFRYCERCGTSEIG